jgi:hypothetical protein
MLIHKNPEIKAEKLISEMLAPKAGTEAESEIDTSLINQDHIKAFSVHKI